MRRRVLGMILAGGRGERLKPLTLYRSKPAVPFGGIYRIIDFVLSNFINSGIKSIYVLTQFKSQSLAEHIERAWGGTNRRADNFIISVPAQMQTPGEVWYEGTADAIWQNMNLIHDTVPDLVCIFGGDHIYFMDISQMMREHMGRAADVTIAAIPVPREEAFRFGVIEAAPDGRVKSFHEKVKDPPTLPSDPSRCYASMGNYVFSRKILEEMLARDAADPDSSHDFGRDILPRMVKEGRAVFAYDFASNRVPGQEGRPNIYWRDVGTVEAYYEACLDLKQVVPQLDLYNRDWPINTNASSAPPAKFVAGASGASGEAYQSILGSGCIVSSGIVRDSVLGRNIRIHSGVEVADSVLFDGVVVERNCKVRRAIIDKDVRLPSGTHVGIDADADRARGWTVSETGITVIPKQPSVRPITTMDL
ncbi:MAG: glucose-1-phosphate adenylyltransferase [Planctomycetes bacterium]|nr:glucose-1-phosphate adenylyltransferase [Planctomycetota bacterium]